MTVEKMVTRCPHCRTAFRIYQHQLEQRKGIVRCGACAGVFDARAHLRVLTGPPSEAPAPTQAPAAPSAQSKEALQRLEAQRLEAQRLAAQRQEAQRQEALRLEAQRLAAQRQEAQRQEALRLEAQRLEAQKLEVQKQEAVLLQRREAQKREAQRLEAEKREAERLEAERRDAQWRDAQWREAQRLEAERAEAERIQKLEAERLAAQRLEAEQREAQRLEAQRLEAERARKLEAERRDAQWREAQLEAERAQRLETEQPHGHGADAAGRAAAPHDAEYSRFGEMHDQDQGPPTVPPPDLATEAHHARSAPDGHGAAYAESAPEDGRGAYAEPLGEGHHDGYAAPLSEGNAGSAAVGERDPAGSLHETGTLREPDSHHAIEANRAERIPKEPEADHEEAAYDADTVDAVVMTPSVDQRAEVPVRVYDAERLVKPPRAKRRRDEFELGARSTAHPIVFGIAAAVLAVILALQAALWFRTDIAGRFPGARPLLAGLCQPFHCTVQWPRKIDDLVIDASDLRADGGVLTLTATLRNRGDLMLALPIIELSITDERGAPLALRRLSPADYLGSRLGEVDGIAAGSDLSISVYIDGAQLAASGYRLLVLYA